MSDTKNETDWFLQKDMQHCVRNKLGIDAWLTIYSSRTDAEESFNIHCALIPNSQVSRVLEDCSWDLGIGDGKPCVMSTDDGIEYLRYGNDQGIEPLTHYREFHGIKPSDLEISEEFRHFHNIHHDPATNKFIKIRDSGEEEDAIRITGANTAEIKLKLIKQFLAFKEVNLAIYFDIIRYSRKRLTDLGIGALPRPFRNNECIYNLSADDSNNLLNGMKAFSRLLGKKLIPGMKKEESGLWPYQERKRESFITGVNKNGDAIESEKGDYLTPIFFKKNVLQKYYNNPEKYTVEDAIVSCGRLWGLRIDSDHEKHVVAYLGDLHKDLPFEEQRYWKAFNVLPEGGISQSAWDRDMELKFIPPARLDSSFKYEYRFLQNKWHEKFGWHLFKPLRRDDEYASRALRIPLEETQMEFDQQVHHLQKILIESLNDKKLDEELLEEVEDGKSISKLERFLQIKRWQGYEEHIKFLRDIHDLRHGSAHLKGKKYDKVAGELLDKNPIANFEGILAKAIEFLKYLKNELG